MNKLEMRKLWYLRRLSFVPRWVVIPTIRKQNVAEHSFHVACIARALIPRHINRVSDRFRYEVLVKALEHDEEEATTGDSPSPTKDRTRATPEQLTAAEIVVKVADKIEAVLFLAEEQSMGNGAVKSVLDDAMRRGEEYWDAFDWRPDQGSKPDFQEMCMIIVNGTSIERHPVLREQQ